MKIWIFSIFDPTTIDKARPMRFANLSSAADRAGLDVSVFSNTFRHSTKQYRYNRTTVVRTHSFFRTVFIHTSAYQSNYSVRRFYSHFRYARNMMKYLSKLKEYPDFVVSAMPPIWINYFLSKWCAKHKVVFIMDIIDPWPDVFLEYLPQKITIYKPFIKHLFFIHNKLVVKSLKRSKAVTAISNKYLIWASQKLDNKVNTQVFYPGVELHDYAICKSQKLQKRNSSTINVVYAGNLGVAYNIPCMIQAIEIVNSIFPDKFRFYFAGSGVYLSEILTAIEKHQNIEYLGQLERSELLKLYAKCDIGLAQYHKNATQTITYKLFDYAAAGLVILNSLQSEMAELIEEYNNGKNNLPGDAKQLANNIMAFNNIGLLENSQKNSLKMAQQIGDNRSIYKDYIDYVISLKNV